MGVKHEVRVGECCSSIAADYGFGWDAIWTHADNDALRSERPDPNTLVPGDVIAIPDREHATESRATGAQHVFHLTCVPLFVCLKLRRVDGSLRANERYELTVAGAVVAEGTTGDDGAVRVAIPAAARAGTLTIGPAESAATFDLTFGTLPPIDSFSGLRARLTNLGYDCGELEDSFDHATRTALRLFQAVRGLDPTGYPDEATMAELQQAHDAFDEDG